MYDVRVLDFARISRAALKTAALCAAVSFAPAAPAASDLEQQRALFVANLERAELGDRSGIDALPGPDRTLLENYVLWPDLEAAWLRATLKDAPDDAIERFLEVHGSLKPARELRYRYALELARRGDLAAYYRIYSAYYADLADPTLDCLAVQARIAAGAGTEVSDAARALWRVGRSQVPECDPVFAWLGKHELLTNADYRARFAKAIDAESFGLARWLGTSMGADYRATAESWLDAQTHPETFLLASDSKPVDEDRLAQLAYAAERLAYRDPARAHELWRPLARRLPFDETVQFHIARHLALWAARNRLPVAAERLRALPAAAVDEEVLRWRTRVSLNNADWDGVLTHTSAMAEPESHREEWRYWRAIALRETGGEALAAAELAALAGERSYYGFLAADELRQEYRFGHADLEPDEALIARLAVLPPLVRARELYFVGQDGRGRSEWDAAIASFTPDEIRQAALLAHRWGWHSRAITAVADIEEYDDLVLRYPLPYRDVFESRATVANIPLPWAYGIARSESLFMRDVRSGAGAIGLMQLLPSTGRDIARTMKLPFAGAETLTDPAHNIMLGTAYLGHMTTRFAGNRVLATAAYNAGPQRVEAWVPRQNPMDARVWIETIPYNETREYVRRVLEAETIFHWRQHAETRRLSDQFATIEPALPAHRLASASR